MCKYRKISGIVHSKHLTVVYWDEIRILNENIGFLKK